MEMSDISERFSKMLEDTRIVETHWNSSLVRLERRKSKIRDMKKGSETDPGEKQTGAPTSQYVDGNKMS